MSAETEIVAAIDRIRSFDREIEISAPKNKGAEDVYLAIQYLPIDWTDLRQKLEDLCRLKYSVDRAVERLDELEYKVDIHISRLGDLAHNM